MALNVYLVMAGGHPLASWTLDMDRARREALRHHAEQHGWQLLDPDAPAPSLVNERVPSNGSRFLMVRQRPCGQVWLRWDYWEEDTTVVGDLYLTVVRHNLTRYLVALPGIYPDVTVRPRLQLSAFIRAHLGQGSGDDFDRIFLIRPWDSVEAAARVTAAMRRALLEKTVPPWRISGGMLITEYNGQPRVENLEEQAAAIERVAALLPGMGFPAPLDVEPDG